MKHKNPVNKTDSSKPNWKPPLNANPLDGLMLDIPLSKQTRELKYRFPENKMPKIRPNSENKEPKPTTDTPSITVPWKLALSPSLPTEIKYKFPIDKMLKISSHNTTTRLEPHTKAQPNPMRWDISNGRNALDAFMITKSIPQAPTHRLVAGIAIKPLLLNKIIDNKPQQPERVTSTPARSPANNCSTTPHSKLLNRSLLKQSTPAWSPPLKNNPSNNLCASFFQCTKTQNTRQQIRTLVSDAHSHNVPSRT
jgi:hypothetical protein